MEIQDDTKPDSGSHPSCKNCATDLSPLGNFCPNCGQKNADRRIRMRDLLTKFLADITHLDNKFVQMCWHLLVPARVTINYFQGKIQRYPHPLQFFFIVMFFFLLMFSKQLGDAGFNTSGGNFNIQLNGEEPEEESESERRLKEVGLMGLFEHRVKALEYRAAFSRLPEDWRVPMVHQALDSVVNLVEGPWETALKDYSSLIHAKDSTLDSNLDSITLNFAFSSVKISSEDLVRHSPDSIIQKYGLTQWDQKVTVRQGIKALRDANTLIHQYVGSFGWAILVLITIMAAVLRLLYWNRGRYYVEHFIFLLHQQSGAFLLLTLALLIHTYLIKLQWLWPFLLIWIGIALLLAMKRFYGGNWGWTLVKWALYCLFYVVGLLALFVGTLLVVFVLF